MFIFLFSLTSFSTFAISAMPLILNDTNMSCIVGYEAKDPITRDELTKYESKLALVSINSSPEEMKITRLEFAELIIDLSINHFENSNPELIVDVIGESDDIVLATDFSSLKLDYVTLEAAQIYIDGKILNIDIMCRN